MKKNNPSIDTLVLITNHQLLKDDISLATYGVALSRGREITAVCTPCAVILIYPLRSISNSAIP